MEDEYRKFNNELEKEIKSMREFEELLEKEKVENPEFSELDFQAKLVNEFLKAHPEVEKIELTEKK